MTAHRPARLRAAALPALPALLAALGLVQSLLAASGPGPLAGPPPAPQRKDIVGAYYYPWYNVDKWKAHAPQLTPVLGQYMGDDLAVVRQHIDTASHYGVDVLFMSWWNKKDLTDRQLRAGYLQAPNNDKVKFAMLVEPLGDLDSLDGKRDAQVDFSKPAVLEGFIDIFRYFKESFFPHPSYFRIGGKPVVLIYVTRTFVNFGPAHLDTLLKHVGPTYIMADEAFLFAQQDPETARNGLRNRQKVFDSYVSYNSYEAAKIIPGDSALAYQRRVAMPYYRAWAEKTPFHPPLMPYYKDFRDGHPPLPGSPAAFRTIIEEIKALPLVHPVDDTLNRVYLVTSWNEWFEGTSIEPSVENGNAYCRVLREAFVEKGLHSRREAVTALRETRARLVSPLTGAPLCVEKDGQGNVTARPGCDASGQALEIVELQGSGEEATGEVALRDIRSGKFLSLWSDSLVYPAQDYIGTWEIFQLARQGENVALRSKKTGTFLRPDPGRGHAFTVGGAALDTDAYLRPEYGPLALGSGPPGGAFRHRVILRGRALSLASAPGGSLRVTVAAPDGRMLAERRLAGGAARAGVLATLPGPGIYVVRVEEAGRVDRRVVAAP